MIDPLFRIYPVAPKSKLLTFLILQVFFSKMRLVLSLAALLGKAVADQCFVCTERFDSNGVLQTDNRFCDKKVKVNLSRYKLYRFLTLRHSE